MRTSIGGWISIAIAEALLGCGDQDLRSWGPGAASRKYGEVDWFSVEIDFLVGATNKDEGR